MLGAAGSCLWHCGVGAGWQAHPVTPCPGPTWGGLQQGSACCPGLGGQRRGPTDPVGTPWGAVFALCHRSPAGVGLWVKPQELIPAGPSSSSPGRRLASGAEGPLLVAGELVGSWPGSDFAQRPPREAGRTGWSSPASLCCVPASPLAPVPLREPEAPRWLSERQDPISRSHVRSKEVIAEAPGCTPSPPSGASCPLWPCWPCVPRGTDGGLPEGVGSGCTQGCELGWSGGLSWRHDPHVPCVDQRAPSGGLSLSLPVPAGAGAAWAWGKGLLVPMLGLALCPCTRRLLDLQFPPEASSLDPLKGLCSRPPASR